MKLKIPMEKLPEDVQVSKELIEEELPVIKQKVIVVKAPKVEKRSSLSRKIRQKQ